MLSLTFFLFLIEFIFSSNIAHAAVPPSATFKLVNEGSFGYYIVEYDATYRPLSIATTPFQLCFYNTTPNAYYLALLVGTVFSTSLFRWVWDFNRGNPVRENATFSLGTNGNLVLADADGRVAWQSGTANKGVIGFELLSTGNMVLYDSKRRFIWQSFDYPTDTLLPGQTLRIGGPSKLVSRASPRQNVNGPYSLVLEPSRFAMYYRGKNSPKPQLYYESSWRFSPYNSFEKLNLKFLKLNVASYSPNEYEITLDYNVPKNHGPIYVYIGRTRYNATITYLRLGLDGTLKAFTFDQDADIMAWEEIFDLFAITSIGTCQLPQKCGNFGVCENGQCVGCPSPNGLLGWSQKCRPPKITSCSVKDVKYYKMVGVDHFVVKYTKGDGPMKESECEKKCSLDCKCGGYFYQLDKSLCWIAYDLMTLTRVGDKKHLAYIKI